MSTMLDRLPALMLANTPQIVVILAGPELRLRYANPAAQVALGHPAAALADQPLGALLPRARPEVLAQIRGVAETGRCLLLREHRTEAVTTDNGEPTFWNLQCLPIDGADDLAEAVLVLAEDVTPHMRLRRALEERAARAEERQRVERRLAEREELLRLALEAADMGQWVYDLQRDEFSYNGTVARQLGRADQPGCASAGEFLGRLHPDDGAELQAKIDRIRGGAEERLHHEYRVLLPAGQTRWLIARGTVTVNPDGIPRRILAINYDVTVDKLRLEALNRANTELEQFAYAASHDLKEPLRTISGFVTLIERRAWNKLDPQEQRFLEHVRHGTEQLQALVHGLLEYARSTYVEPAPEQVALNELFDEVVGQLGSAVGESGAEVSRDDLPQVRGDRVLLSHLLQNLIGNAIKYRGEQPPRIHLSVSEDAACWRFQLQDNGRGIPVAELDRVFEPFHRAGPRGGQGSVGLGLALSRRIVLQHRGAIWVESTPGAGSRFIFTLPRGEAGTPPATDLALQR